MFTITVVSKTLLLKILTKIYTALYLVHKIFKNQPKVFELKQNQCLRECFVK